jgi:cobalamin biosynthesis Mg chelatase CobN
MGATQSTESDVSPGNAKRSKCAQASGSSTPSEKVYEPNTENNIYYWIDFPDNIKAVFDAAAVVPPAPKKPVEEPSKGEVKGPVSGTAPTEKAPGAADGAPGAGAPPKGSPPKVEAKEVEKRITFALYEAKAKEVEKYLPTVEHKKDGTTEDKKVADTAAAAKFKEVFKGDEKDGGLLFKDFKLNWAKTYGARVDVKAQQVAAAAKQAEEKKKADEAAAAKKATGTGSSTAGSSASVGSTTSSSTASSSAAVPSSSSAASTSASVGTQLAK